MDILKEACRTLCCYLYQSRVKRSLSQFFWRAAHSRFNGVRRLGWWIIHFNRAVLDYFKFKINDKAMRDISLDIREDTRRLPENCSHSMPCGEQLERGTKAYPKITIITPNYNQGRFLEECIQSVLSQNYPNLEYIVIDGGSTDNSIEVIKKYDKQIDYWISEKDNGQSDAINKGLRHATGEICNWLNSDDRLEPGALFCCAEAYRENPSAAGWIGACSRIDETGEIVEIVYPNGLDRDNIGENWNGRQFYQPSCFLSTAKVREIGGLNADLYIALDLDLWIRILQEGEFVVGKGIWSRAINHDDAKTQKSVDKMLQETVSLQGKYGFSEGAGKRSKMNERKYLEYTIPGSLKQRLEEKINSAKMREMVNVTAFNKRRNICFAGDFNSEPDIDAVIYFLKNVFQYILKENWVEFHVIGNNTEKLKKHIKVYNVKFMNLDRNVHEVLSKYKLFVCPATQKGGLRGKIGIAAAAGLPVVTTSIGAEGFPVKDGEECFIADHPMEFGEKCNQCLNDPITWHNFSLKSQLMMAEKFGFPFAARECAAPLHN